jgi:hypothetical protein
MMSVGNMTRSGQAIWLGLFTVSLPASFARGGRVLIGYRDHHARNRLHRRIPYQAPTCTYVAHLLAGTPLFRSSLTAASNA